MYGIHNLKLWQMIVAIILVECLCWFFSRGKPLDLRILFVSGYGEMCVFFVVIFLLEKGLWEYFSNKTLLIEFLISAIVGIWIFIRKDTVFYKLGAFCLILPSLLLDIVGIVLLFFALITD